jgi:hypothetical protein
MPCYSFSIQNADGSRREYVGRIALRDDGEARAFGVAMIWDMRDAAALYEACTMHVAVGKRAAFEIRFERTPVAARRTDWRTAL